MRFAYPGVEGRHGGGIEEEQAGQARERLHQPVGVAPPVLEGDIVRRDTDQREPTVLGTDEFE
jgi:hypothetical protein